MSISIDLVQQRILVVGGSAGIGRGVALAAGNAGARVAVVGRRQERLDDVVDTIGSGVAIAGDVSDAAECERVVREAVDALGGLDALVFSAGVSILAELEHVDGQAWRDILTTNTVAPALVTRAALPWLGEGGVVIYLSSITVGGRHVGLGPYSSSKAALNNMVGAWRAERPDKRFVCLSVGDTVDTEFSRDFDMDTAIALFPRMLAAGVMHEHNMESADLGQGITEILATLLAHPHFTIPELTIVPPGGMKSADPGEMPGEMAGAADALSAQQQPGGPDSE